jgi:hypothetical protein
VTATGGFPESGERSPHIRRCDAPLTSSTDPLATVAWPSPGSEAATSAALSRLAP